MEKEKSQAMVFFILGIAFNTIGMSNKNDSLKISFIGAGSVFLIIAIYRFAKISKEKND